MSVPDENELHRYIEGWLQCREKGDKGKFKTMWCVLEGKLGIQNMLISACLSRFKDQNTHVPDHCVGSHQIKIEEHSVSLLSCKGDKPMKCEFTVKINDTKLTFIADDQISQERWIYALVDLVGKGLSPSELPTQQNSVRSYPKQQLLRGSKKKRSVSVASLPSGANRSFRLRRMGKSMDATEDMLSLSLDEKCIRTLKMDLDDLGAVSWYHGDKDRSETENVLRDKLVGSYLLRNYNEPGCYTLSYKDTDKIKHHIIKQKGFHQYQFHLSEIEKIFESPQFAVRYFFDQRSQRSNFTSYPIARLYDQTSPASRFNPLFQGLPQPDQVKRKATRTQSTPADNEEVYPSGVGYTDMGGNRERHINIDRKGYIEMNGQQKDADDASRFNPLFRGMPQPDQVKRKATRTQSTPAGNEEVYLGGVIYTDMGSNQERHINIDRKGYIEMNGQQKDAEDAYLRGCDVTDCVKNPDYANLARSTNNNDSLYMNNEKMRLSFGKMEPAPPPIPPRKKDPQRLCQHVYGNT